MRSDKHADTYYPFSVNYLGMFYIKKNEKTQRGEENILLGRVEDNLDRDDLNFEV